MVPVVLFFHGNFTCQELARSGMLLENLILEHWGSSVDNFMLADELEKMGREWFKRWSKDRELIERVCRRLRVDGAFFSSHETDTETREDVIESR